MTFEDVKAFFGRKPSDDLRKYSEECRLVFEALLGEFVRYPSISMDKTHRKDVIDYIKKAAELVACLGEKPNIVELEGGTPVLFWKLIRNLNWPTFTLYNHGDKMPAGDGWRSNPFELKIEQESDGNRRYFGRGVSDNTGPALVGLLAINYAIKNNIPANFVIIWETEEEIGSRHFSQFLQSKKEELLALPSPYLLVSDTTWQDIGCPTITCALRGLLSFILELTTAVEVDKEGHARQKENHSGAAGNAAPNPITELTHLISQCVEKGGGICIPGFYEGTEEAPVEDIEYLIKKGIFSVEKFKATYGLKCLPCDDPKEIIHRIWDWPTMELVGIHGGTTQENEVKSSIPGSAQAWVSCRVGPGQDVQDLEQKLRDFVAEINPEVVIRRVGGAIKPVLIDKNAEHIKAGEEALREGYGYDEVVFDRCGGSIGVVVEFLKLIPGLKPILMGISRPDDNAHGANENFDWVQASGGIRTFVHYFNKIANT